MIKTIIISIALIMVTCVAPASVQAEERVCVTQYGGSVVCGSNPPQIHTPVKTGITDINFKLVGFGLITMAGLLSLKSKRTAH